MSQLTNTTTNAISNPKDAASNVLKAAQEEIGEPILKFNKGTYAIRDEKVPLGTEFLAHPEAWMKEWIKFVDGTVAPGRRLYRVANGEKPVEREELDDLDPAKWPELDGRRLDPWVLQSYLPLQNLKTGEFVVFVTQSIGGGIAVGELASAWAKRERAGQHGQPIIKLASKQMPTKKYDTVPRPHFEIVRWDEAAEREDNKDELAAAIPVQPMLDGKKKKKVVTVARHDDMDDEIPF